MTQPIYPAVPYVACQIPQNLSDELKRIHQALQSGGKESHAKETGYLVTEASCHLMDRFFGDMISELATRDADPLFRESAAVIREIQSKLRHYLGWITSHFSNERLRPVIAHFVALHFDLPSGLHNEGVLQSHLTFPVSPDLATQAQASLQALRDGTAPDAREGIEILIKIIDEGLQPLLFQPKKLMHFNFIVDKSLNGVSSLMMTLSHHSLLKLGKHLHPQHFELVADHLEQFLKTE